MGIVRLFNELYHAIGRRFRARRLKQFEADFPAACYRNVIDVGGTPAFWGESERDLTLVNIGFANQPSNPRIKLEVGSGMHLQHSDNSFDLAFSNSTIEHLGTYANQKLFAAELRRVSGTVYCQTPNRWFPFEVHYWSLFLHWFPSLLDHYFVLRYLTGWGWLVRPSRKEALEYHAALNILTRSEFARLFPDCEIRTEKFLGMTKSFTAVRQ
jgi:hypothetical protein